MTKRSHKRKIFEAPKGSTREKGDIVEQIVADMHNVAGIQVERDVFLPAKDGSGRTCEIDVLLSGQIAGYLVRVAIECKNEKKRIGVDEINEFIGKLDDAGIPIQHGIFVSASRYASGALLRAQAAGIKTLMLKDTTDRLPESVRQAFQSVIYLLLTITNIEVRSDADGEVQAGEILFFRNREGKMCGAVPDLVWREWQSGNISEELGSYQINVQLPADWFHVVKGKVTNLHGIKVAVQVTGHIVTYPGSVRRHALLNASTQSLERWQLQARFEKPSGSYPVTVFLNEKDLQGFLNEARGTKISLGCFRLPRIRWGPMYWPPSESAIQKLFALAHQASEQGKTFDFARLDLAEIEGTDMNKLWEPIWKEHSSAKESRD